MLIASSPLVWSIGAYCQTQYQSSLQQKARWESYPDSTQAWLDTLNLPSIHPFCSEDIIAAGDDGNNSRRPITPYEIEGVPPQGPLLHFDHLETPWDVVITVCHMWLPSLYAMGELWIRLLASIIAPTGIAQLMWYEIYDNRQKGKNELQNQGTMSIWTCLICLFSVASSIVLLTDSLYVVEFGHYGGCLLVLSTVLSWRTCRKYEIARSTMVGLLLLWMLAFYLIYDFGSGQFHFGEPLEHVNFPEGIYYDASNPRMERIIRQWPKERWTYATRTGATSWMPTGDSRTGLPFLLNKVPTTTVWDRVWVSVEDGEVVALDISFPSSGHDRSKPMFLVLHGLNGGSQEEFVREFANRQNAKGSTVVVMIARGLMDLPIRGMNIFHGARWTDANQAGLALRQALGEGQLLAGVGFSMGAIILSNYVARSGKNCALDAAVAISGGLDLRFQTYFYRAQRLWQPLLMTQLRNNFVVGKWGEKVRSRLTKQQIKTMMRAKHITEFDDTVVVTYNGFDNLEHYYSEMSVLGDVPMSEYASGRFHSSRRIQNISIPLCVIHALDDPLITWRTVASNQGLMYPSNLTQLGSSNLVLLLTSKGGHVGWPLGLIPGRNGWKWMNEAASSFVEAVSHVPLN